MERLRWWMAVALALSCSLSMATGLGAQELNQREDINPEAGAKIERMEAESMREHSQQNQPLTQPAQCGVSAGNVNVTNNAQAPREVTTVITGDVISVCK
jgi:hypothetical protein